MKVETLRDFYYSIEGLLQRVSVCHNSKNGSKRSAILNLD